ncbi:hypothetical protein A9Q84_01650 [Halobacteriovorax marinus]|uniref:histidine kinase n=1 Tax=Halobacteriovorax marinus TaxID=97084 RepID=A0A1Y5FG76_9BACT|nr:hypothetical protein A9Q84_01650 [Halobacteriovorax marinus]
MKNQYTIWGTFAEASKEKMFLETTWQKNKFYGFLTYFLCCLFFVFAGVFGDYHRVFHTLGANELLVLRYILLHISISFYYVHRKSSKRPQSAELWMDSMKYLSTLVILLLTIWTKGTSITLLPGIMMMVASFYVILPGRLLSTNICAIVLLITFAVWQNPAVTFGNDVHNYMIFMLYVIEVLLLFFKCKIDRWARLEFETQLKLDEINRTKDKILATIAHDIRNPLAIIHSKASMSNTLLKRGEYSKVKERQDSIVKSVLNLDQMLLDIVEWALSELQLGKNSKKEGCINSTVKRAINFVNEQAESKDINFSLDLEPTLFFYEDKLMETCIRNILTNAIKFSTHRTVIDISGEKDGAQYVLKVSDQGCGMEQALVKNILNGSNHNSEFGTEGETGTGFGLKLVKNVILRHDGEMKINSIIGKGTTFTFHLPLGLENA